jgi:hypothetical protein
MGDGSVSGVSGRQGLGTAGLKTLRGVSPCQGLGMAGLKTLRGGEGMAIQYRLKYLYTPRQIRPQQRFKQLAVIRHFQVQQLVDSSQGTTGASQS